MLIERDALGRAIARHGHARRGTHDGTYNTWRNMRLRCDPVRGRENYGLRGIRVCARLESFDAFLADMGPRPRGTTLDRIDNDKGYEPGNCRWATPREQRRNMQGDRRITANGRSLTAIEWSEITGINPSTIRNRIARGWSDADAVNPRPLLAARRNNAIGLRGVWRDKKRGTWQSSIGINGRIIRLGRFATSAEAHAAYVAAFEQARIAPVTP